MERLNNEGLPRRYGKLNVLIKAKLEEKVDEAIMVLAYMKSWKHLCQRDYLDAAVR